MTKAETARFEKLFADAKAAGMAAVAKTVVPAMVVSQHASPLDDASPVTHQWVVPDGVCGFAWVTLRPGTSKAARFAKKFLGARTAYGGGMQLWVSDFNQSMTKKEAFAEAFAKVLRDGGVEAFAGSRMD